MRILLAAALYSLLTNGLHAGGKPEGKFLFQPMLIWGTSEVSHQGTGYFMRCDSQSFGVTSIHFLNFEAGGLFEAIWLDVHSSRPVTGFKTCLGKPKVTAINNYEDIKSDFLLMPIEKIPDGYAAIEIESVPKYPQGHKLWFPNKSRDERLGYNWIEAEVVEDKGHMIKVKLLSKITLRSQSGSPVFSQETGKAIGMLTGGDENEILLCPTREILDALKTNPKPISLMEGIRKE